jgi:hypothetical protein
MTTDPTTIAELCERSAPPPEYPDDTWMHIFAGDVRLFTTTIEALAARLATVEAERDAAVAQMQTMTDTANDTWSMGAAEGERRAVARIVAWLRGDTHGYTTAYAWCVADGLERGDHLQEGE